MLLSLAFANSDLRFSSKDFEKLWFLRPDGSQARAPLPDRGGSRGGVH